MNGTFKKFDCKTCSANEFLKIERGCEKESPIPVGEIVCVRCGGNNDNCTLCKGSGTEKINRCPVKTFTSDTARFFNYYNFYRQGFLPSSGGILDQTAQFVEAVRIVDNEMKDEEK